MTRSIPRTTRGVSRLAIATIAALVCVAALPTPASADIAEYNNNTDGIGQRFSIDNRETFHRDWMAAIPDDTSLADLSIPGTHDSAAYTEIGFADTQGLSLRYQLDSGIRAWDIRFKQIDNVWELYHGDIHLDYYDYDEDEVRHGEMRDVLEEAARFLTNHPAETIIMSIQDAENRQGEDDNTLSHNDVFREFFDSSYRDLFWSNPNTSEPCHLPTLGDVRGKVVVLRRWGNSHSGSIGVDDAWGMEWGSDTGGGSCGRPDSVLPTQGAFHEDEYKICSATARSQKLDMVESFLAQTNANQAVLDTLPISFMTGNNGTCGAPRYGPGDYAHHLNPAVTNLLFDGVVRGTPITRTGVLFTDYAGGALIDMIIAQNWQLFTDPGPLDDELDEVMDTLAHVAHDRAAFDSAHRNQLVHAALIRLLPEFGGARGRLSTFTVGVRDDPSPGHFGLDVAYAFDAQSIAAEGEAHGYKSVAFTSGPAVALPDLQSDLEQVVSEFGIADTASVRNTRIQTFLHDAYPDANVGSLVKFAPGVGTDLDHTFSGYPDGPPRADRNGFVHLAWVFLDEDFDGDGLLDGGDNCPSAPNPDQEDFDNNGVGDACDDWDEDGVLDVVDNCRSESNADQEDIDGDGEGDVCDRDRDGDGHYDYYDVDPDNCRTVPNPGQIDTDGDGEGDACDVDDDGDGLWDAEDLCPLVATPFTFPRDSDHDGLGDECDDDDDNDGVADVDDEFQFDDTETSDADDDGVGDNADTDDDNDGVADVDDEFPLDETETSDADDDGVGDNADTDDDNDGVADVDDEFPLDETETSDADDDGVGDNADTDDDDDSATDDEEVASGSDPLDPASTPEVCDGLDNDGNNGIDEGFADSDGDGDADCVDPDDDGDGYSDDEEIAAGSDPLDPASIPNAPPVVEANGPYSVDEGGSVSLATSASDPDGDALTYAWRVDGEVIGTEPTASFDASDLDGGDSPAVSVSFEACDPHGACTSDSTTVTVLNVAPSVALEATPTADEGATVVLEVSVDDPAAADAVSIEVDWGDGATTTHELGTGRTTSLEHVYADDDPSGTSADTYGIAVTATDDDGGEGAATTATLVANVAPEVALSGAAAVDEGSTYTLGIEIEDPAPGDSFTVEIDWGDATSETFSTTERSLERTHVYADDHAGRPVTVTVTDDDGGEGAAGTTVRVDNVAPGVSVSAPVIDEGGTATITGAITDPGLQDSFTVSVDWGDGAETQTLEAGSTSFTATRHYADDDPSGTPSDVHAVAVLVADDDGGEGTAATTATVHNVAPGVTVSATAAIDEGGVAQLEVGIDDPGTDTFVVTADWGDGTTETVAASATGTLLTHLYADDDPTGTQADSYLIGVTVVDDDTGSASTSTEVTVHNVAPTVTAELEGPAVFDRPVALGVAWNDPGERDTHTLGIDWGDGHIDAVDPAVSAVELIHTYGAAGSYTVTITVTDDDGDAGATSVEVDVDRAPTVLEAEPGLLGGGLLLRPLQASARLTRADTGAPVAGETVVVTVPALLDPTVDVEVCTAVTDAGGVATCAGSLNLWILLALGYDAHYEGGRDHHPADAHAPLVKLGGLGLF